jgi:hypothetical protein
MAADLERWVMLTGIVAVPLLTVVSYAIVYWLFRHDGPDDEIEHRNG